MKIKKRVKARKVYGYSGTTGRYVGLVPVKRFIEEVAQKDRSSKNWVRERYSATGNIYEVEKAYKRPGKIIKVR